MSLQVWLPLNGNLNNQGILNCSITAGAGITFSNDGKTGKCVTCSNSDTITITIPNLADMITNGKKYTLACWVKPTGVNDNGWVIKLGTAQNGLWWAKSTARWVWNENDNGKRVIGTPIADDYTNWHHLVTTVDKTNPTAIVAKHYVDGQPAEGYASQTWNNGSFTLPAGNDIVIYPQNAQLCDVRLYNNVLTAEEIKKISQALVLHWPLNNAPLSNLHSRPSILPPEYQEVEYIESTGSEYINTGWVPTIDCGVIAKGAFLSYASSAPMIGSGPTGGSRFFPLAWTSNQSLRFTYGNAEYSRNYIIGEEIFVTFNKPARKLYINGELKHTYGNTYTVSTNPLYLFGTSGYGGNLYLNQSRLWFVRIFDNGDQIKRNLVPCYRISDKKPGLYDTVNGIFYTNASGSGEFICGPLVKSIPNIYMPVEYLQSAGNAYIDTGWLPPANNWQTETIYYFNQVNTNDHCIAGTRDGIGKMVNLYHEGIESWLGTWVPSVHYKAGQEVYLLNKCINSSKLLYINYYTGTFQQTGSGITTANTGTNTLPIFGFRESNGAVNWRFTGYLKFYRIWENNIPVRDMRPCVRISDKKPGMYDLVNDVFYTNAGTGEFDYCQLTTEYDISGYHRNGTYLLPNILVNNESINRFKRVYNFTTSGSAIIGTDDFNTIPEFTYSCWIKPSTTRVMYNIAGYRLGNNSYRSLSIDNSLGSGFHTYISGSDIQVGAVTPSVYDNKWHMLTVTYDGTTIMTYTDGTKTNEQTVTLQQPTGQFSINYPDTNNMNRYYVGDISDVRVYATALDSGVIQELYHMGKTS